MVHRSRDTSVDDSTSGGSSGDPAAAASRSESVAEPQLSTRELVARSSIVLDLAPNTARLLVLGGAIGVVIIFVASLTGGRPETVELDKLLHFAGYAVLAAVFVLALPPRRYMVALASLAAVGALIEFLQPFNTRSRDLLDLGANLLGLALGAAIGLGTRVAYGYIKGELSAARVRRRLVRYPAGAIILREGQPIDHFWIVRSGVVELSRIVDGGTVEITRAEAGDTIGVLAEVLRIPQYATGTAVTDVEVYAVDFDDLVEEAGGRQRPLGALVETLATDLREAWDVITRLRAQARDEPRLS